MFCGIFWSSVALIVCFLFVPELADALDCSSNSQDVSHERFPQNVSVKPPQFHTRMEITLTHRNETYFVIEEFNSNEQRGAFTLLANEYTWETYWDKLENEIDNVFLDDCLSYNW